MSTPNPGFARPPNGVRANLGATRRYLKQYGLIVGLVAAFPAAACPLPAPALQVGAIQAVWAVANGEPIQVGRHFVLEVQLCPANAQLLRIDAVMPDHGHGMNYRASVAALPGAGRWRAEGLLFQMPGSWELRLDVQAAGRTERLRQTIVVP